jgi:hypothetical protein
MKPLGLIYLPPPCTLACLPACLPACLTYKHVLNLISYTLAKRHPGRPGRSTLQCVSVGVGWGEDADEVFER